MDDKPVWKTLLSVGLTLFAVIRLVMTCNNSSRSSSRSYQTSDSETLNYALEQNRERYMNSTENNVSNEILNASYDSISKLSDSEMAIYKIRKVKKDTLLPLDLTTKINIESNSFIQKNYDDSLQLAVKLPDNTSIFLHAYSSQDNIMDNFKSVKKKSLDNMKLKVDDPDSKFVSYTYKRNGKKYNGWALLVAENGQFTSLEFENNKISKSDLELKAISFIAQISK